MSIEAMTQVLNHSQATGRAKLVLIGIANHQGDNGAWPSIETLARYANASERSVIRDIQELEAMGELIVERNAAPVRGQYRPNLYWVNISGVTDLTPGVTESRSGVTSQVVRGDTVVTQNVINLKEKLNKPNAQIIESAFALFWEAYPRKVGKIAAEKAFAKSLEVVDAQTLITAAWQYNNDPYLPASRQFIPYPATWLNRGSWDDGPLPERELTLEERHARARVKAEADRESNARESERRRAEAEEAKKNAAPPPKCEHGNSIVSCRICLNVGSRK